MTPFPSLTLAEFLPETLVSDKGLPPFTDQAAEKECLVWEVC